ncbi:HD domain-containing protein [Chryseobacterium daecheongense]|uniref:Metal-dependent HD superfamily phosphohydrolase n=1 Tax=Chryseobacterium daecheongense TaxID=192389 RepID=A0A3N0VZH0_9FLAO|nr:hypothetical protein [Chryseobacterium daecheongense]ROH98189.1 hypothetical protein EGI05_10675 [Chryseobacterium daecheongense]TDX93012.1 putative metal-dependent HD superfamily phosphohydrolase [Chryseobacterium daecheongense]
MDLKERFLQNCLKFSENRDLIENLWLKIEKKHSEKGRFYHNLDHLENMFLELEAVKDQILNYTAITFSVFYHDIIYDATSRANEEKSAEFAVSRLEELNTDQAIIKEVFEQILATKTHQISNHHDTNYLLDADLSILGKDPETYMDYTKKIRKEYSFYPNLLYKPGRKKVLQHFLELESIFKTDYFKSKYEKQAKENIQSELNNL